MIDLYRKYQTDVISGHVSACLYVRQAVERHLSDLERQRTPGFPYYFDEAEADRWLKFISICRHTEGKWKGQPFNIQPFQAWRWAVIFGWKRLDGYRRFRRAYIEVARKQGKTQEAAALGTGALLIDGENTPQIYSAATTRQQAKIVFGAAKIMARQLKSDSITIDKMLKPLAHAIVNTGTDGKMEALSSDAWTLDGLSPSFAIIDEYHEHPTSEVLEVLETGMGARSQPLAYIITTAGFNIASPCFQLRGYAVDVLSGLKKDEAFFSAIYTLDEGDDWNDEAVWVKSNPQIGITPTWDYMRAKYTAAVNEGGQSEVQFKTKNLNVWTTSSETWLSDEIWMRTAGKFDPKSLEGKVCYAGIDFAAVSDFTALSLLFPNAGPGGEHIILPHFWIPEDTLRQRGRDWPDMLNWQRRGLITVIPGDTISLTEVEPLLRQMLAKYDVRRVGYDPYNAWEMIGRMQADGIPMERFGNTVADMSPPAKEFERLVRLGKIQHGGNPVLRWMVANVVPKYNAKNDLMLGRIAHNKTSKIDGVVASVIALGCLMKYPLDSVYAKADIHFI